MRGCLFVFGVGGGIGSVVILWGWGGLAAVVVPVLRGSKGG